MPQRELAAARTEANNHYQPAMTATAAFRQPSRDSFGSSPKPDLGWDWTSDRILRIKELVRDPSSDTLKLASSPHFQGAPIASCLDDSGLPGDAKLENTLANDEQYNLVT